MDSGPYIERQERNVDIRRILGVACITDKVREARLRWFGHVQRREEEDCVRRILEADVRGQRSRGRQRKRWIDVVKYNMEDLRLDLMDVDNRAEWRWRTCVADPSPEGFPAGRRERERDRTAGNRNIQESLANAKVSARQHCVSLSCLCNSLTQIEWVADFSLGDEDSENIASERYENWHLRRPLSCLTPHISRTPANIWITLTSLESTFTGLHFCC